MSKQAKAQMSRRTRVYMQQESGVVTRQMDLRCAWFKLRQEEGDFLWQLRRRKQETQERDITPATRGEKRKNWQIQTQWVSPAGTAFMPDVRCFSNWLLPPPGSHCAPPKVTDWCSVCSKCKLPIENYWKRPLLTEKPAYWENVKPKLI